MAAAAAPTVCASTAPSLPASSPVGCPLWERLAALQPTFFYTPRGGHTLTHPADTAAPSLLSHSCAVVPPPVPEATVSFRAHVDALAAGLRPEFFTITSYSPFFLREEDERDAAVGRQTSCARSAAQEAVRYVVDDLHVPAVLTVTATRATFSIAAADTDASTASATTSRASEEECARAELGPRDSLLGATRCGVEAVLSSFTRTVERAAHGEVPVARGGVLALRGDDGGYTRQTVLAQPRAAVAPMASPYADFADSAALLAFCRAAAPLTMCVGGYPQGHALVKHWDTARETADDAAEGAEAVARAARRRSLLFLEAIDAVVASTNVPRAAQHSTASVRTTADGASARAALKETLDRAERILRRMTDGALRLCEVQTSASPLAPSITPPAAGAAHTHQASSELADDAAYRRRSIRDELVRAKLLARSSAGASAVPQATVVLTQMMASADEFLAYADTVHDVLAEELVAASDSESSVVVVVVPGMMAPLPAEEYARAILQLKVVPSAATAHALQQYTEGLTAAIERLRRCAEELSSSSESCSSHADRELQVFTAAKEQLERRFEDTQVALCIDACKALRARGYHHVNWSCFSYSSAPAVKRVAEGLAIA